MLRNSTHEQFSGPCLTFPMDLLKSSRQLFFPGLFSLFSKTATMSREKTFIWQHKRVCPENGLSFIGFYSLVILGQVFITAKKDKWILVMQNCITKIVGWTVAWNHLAMQDLQSPKKIRKKCSQKRKSFPASPFNQGVRETKKLEGTIDAPPLWKVALSYLA